MVAGRASTTGRTTGGGQEEPADVKKTLLQIWSNLERRQQQYFSSWKTDGQMLKEFVGLGKNIKQKT